jgi:hypothetical protein
MNSFPVSGATSPNAERPRERPLSWFDRAAWTPPMSEEGEVEERIVSRVLTTKDEYEMMPKWRREVARERVREMRAWIGIRV